MGIRATKADVQATLGGLYRAEALKIAAGNKLISKSEQAAIADPTLAADAKATRDAHGPHLHVNDLVDHRMKIAMGLVKKANQASGPGARFLSQAEIAQIRKVNDAVGRALAVAYDVVVGRSQGPAPTGGGLSVAAQAALRSAFEGLQWFDDARFTALDFADLSPTFELRLAALNQGGDGPDANSPDAGLWTVDGRVLTSLAITFTDGVDVEIFGEDGSLVGRGLMQGDTWRWSFPENRDVQQAVQNIIQDTGDLLAELGARARVDGALRGGGNANEVPQSVRSAFDFYFKQVESQDWGSVRVTRQKIAGQELFVVGCTTDGDDGYVEIYDRQGGLVTAGLADYNRVAWGSVDSVRTSERLVSD